MFIDATDMIPWPPPWVPWDHHGFFEASVKWDFARAGVVSEGDLEVGRIGRWPWGRALWASQGLELLDPWEKWRFSESLWKIWMEHMDYE